MDVPSGWLEGIFSIEYSAPQSRQMRVSLFNILFPLLRDITVEAMNVYYLSRYYRCASDETRGVFLSGKEEGRGNRGKGSSVSPFSGESCPRASERPGHKKRKRGGEGGRAERRELTLEVGDGTLAVQCPTKGLALSKKKGSHILSS